MNNTITMINMMIEHDQERHCRCCGFDQNWLMFPVSFYKLFQEFYDHRLGRVKFFDSYLSLRQKEIQKRVIRSHLSSLILSFSLLEPTMSTEPRLQLPYVLPSTSTPQLNLHRVTYITLCASPTPP